MFRGDKMTERILSILDRILILTIGVSVGARYYGTPTLDNFSDAIIIVVLLTLVFFFMSGSKDK